MDADEVACPACNAQGEVVAITYAFHRVLDEGSMMVFDHSDWSDNYALVCHACGWEHDDPAKPDSTMPLEEALNPKLAELARFEEELRRAKEGANGG